MYVVAKADRQDFNIAPMMKNAVMDKGQSVTSHCPSANAGLRYVRGLSEITVTPLILPSLDKGIYGANMCNSDT